MLLPPSPLPLPATSRSCSLRCSRWCAYPAPPPLPDCKIVRFTLTHWPQPQPNPPPPLRPGTLRAPRPLAPHLHRHIHIRRRPSGLRLRCQPRQEATPLPRWARGRRCGGGAERRRGVRRAGEGAGEASKAGAADATAQEADAAGDGNIDAHRQIRKVTWWLFISYTTGVFFLRTTSLCPPPLRAPRVAQGRCTALWLS